MVNLIYFWVVGSLWVIIGRENKLKEGHRKRNILDIKERNMKVLKKKKDKEEIFFKEHFIVFKFVG